MACRRASEPGTEVEESAVIIQTGCRVAASRTHAVTASAASGFPVSSTISTPRDSQIHRRPEPPALRPTASTAMVVRCASWKPATWTSSPAGALNSRSAGSPTATSALPAPRNRRRRVRPSRTASISPATRSRFRVLRCILPRLEGQRRRVDAVSQTGRGGAIGEQVPEMRVAAAAEDLRASHQKLLSSSVATWPGAAGAPNDGQPVPESNLLSEEKSSCPQATQRYVPAAW